MHMAHLCVFVYICACIQSMCTCVYVHVRTHVCVCARQTSLIQYYKACYWSVPLFYTAHGTSDHACIHSVSSPVSHYRHTPGVGSTWENCSQSYTTCPSWTSRRCWSTLDWNSSDSLTPVLTTLKTFVEFWSRWYEMVVLWPWIVHVIHQLHRTNHIQPNDLYKIFYSQFSHSQYAYLIFIIIIHK